MKYLWFLNAALAATLVKLDPSYDGEDSSVESTLPRPDIKSKPTSHPLDKNTFSNVLEYKPINSRNPDTPELKTLSLEKEDREADSRYDDKWDIAPYQPPTPTCDGFPSKTSQEELLDTYADRFSSIFTIASLKTKAAQFFGKIPNTFSKEFNKSYFLDKKNISDTIPEDRIQKIEFYFSKAKHEIHLAQLDAHEELIAVYSAAKQQAAKIFFKEDDTKSESETPGRKEHTYYIFAQEIEKMHHTTAEAIHGNATKFYSKLQQWYLKKLDEKYQATLKKRKDEEEEVMKRVYAVVGFGMGY